MRLREFEFGQRLSFTHDGLPHLNYSSYTWLLDDNNTPHVTETGYWRLSRPFEPGDSGPGMLQGEGVQPFTTARSVETLRNADDGFDIEVSILHPGGVSELYIGQVKGPRIELATDAVMRTVHREGVRRRHPPLRTRRSAPALGMGHRRPRPGARRPTRAEGSPVSSELPWPVEERHPSARARTLHHRPTRAARRQRDRPALPRRHHPRGRRPPHLARLPDLPVGREAAARRHPPKPCCSTPPDASSTSCASSTTARSRTSWWMLRALMHCSPSSRRWCSRSASPSPGWMRRSSAGSWTSMVWYGATPGHPSRMVGGSTRRPGRMWGSGPTARSILSEPTNLPAVDPLALEALRIAAWRPDIRDTDEKSIPHELDWMRSAVHLSKGCYRGQETVAKVHNLGHPPRRLVLLHLDGVLPAVGDAGVARRCASRPHHRRRRPLRARPDRPRGDQALAPRSTRSSTWSVDGIPVAAAQEVIVPPDAGAVADIPRIPRLGAVRARAKRPVEERRAATRLETSHR